MSCEPTLEELKDALNEYARAIGTPGWEIETRHRLANLRANKLTWFGTAENEFRYVIDNALNERCRHD